MTTPESANAPAVDELLISAAHTLAAGGQSKFMDIDLIRLAYGSRDQAPVTGHEIVDSLTRLCETGQIVPFIDPVIQRALLRSPRQYTSRKSTTPGQVLTALKPVAHAQGTKPERHISGADMLHLVRLRNVLVSFRLPDAAEDDFS